jgi:ferritin-like metal-binding protein YciE
MKKQDMTIEELYIHELQDTYSAETQITKALPKVIEACQSPELVEALKTHLEETKTQIKRLEQVFANHGEEASGNHCEGMEGLVKEGDEAIKEIAKGPVRDAALIAGCQKIEHYEISAYGTLCALAEQCGFTDDVEILRSIQDEEYNADEILNNVAMGSVNADAAGTSTAGASR